MSKKTNTLLFLLGATFFNVMVSIAGFILYTVLYARFIMSYVPESGQAWSFLFIFIAAIATSFIVYRYVLKYFMSKVDVEKYFDPLFAKKYKKK